MKHVRDACRRVPDERLWQVRAAGRPMLIKAARERVRRQRAACGAAGTLAECAALLDPNALTIGFARRFASHKRPTLLLRDPARLTRLLNDAARPVQIIIASKAHPRDAEDQRLIRE